jgi:hypothetical protein
MNEDRHISTAIIAVVLVGAFVVSTVPASAIVSGMVGVPDANVSEDYPAGSTPPLGASELEGSVMASDHAETLEVIVTSPDRASDYLNDSAVLSGGSSDVALVLRDDTHSAGRKVAIDAAAVREALGFVPERAYGTHEDGSEWSSSVEYEGGLLVFDVPHFSTNTVTFSGSVTVTATPAVDGSSYSYDIDDAEAASDPNVTFTGALSTENDTDTFSSLSDGDISTLSVAGTAEPTGPSASNEPEITITAVGNAGSSSFCVRGSCGGGTSIDLLHDGGGLTEMQFTPSESGEVSALKPDVANNFATSPDADINIDTGEVDGSASGTGVYNYWQPTEGVNNLDISNYYVEAGETYHIEIVTGSSEGGSVTVDADFSGETGVYENGEYNNANPDFKVEIADGVTDPSIDLNNDGSNEVSISGGIGKGSSVTREVPSLDTSTSEFAVSATAGAVDVQVDYTERTTTNDPSVTINGNHTLSYSGSLPQGESVTLSGDSAWIDPGVNNVTVSTSSASADAPEPAVKLNYTHSAVDQQVVDYTAEKWSERYNVSKTFASDRTGASVTIPFADEVVSVSSVETRTNGGSWSSVTQSNYGFDGTTLTVDVGDVSAGDTVTVRTTARKVSVINGSITVTEPTTMSNRLDSEIRLDSWSGDSYISLGGSPDEGRLHYAYNASWSSLDDDSEVTANGYNRLYLPNAGAGGTARVSTVPLRVNVETGAARFAVTEPSTTEPAVRVTPGSIPGDTVEYTFLNAQDGETYILYSESEGVVHDSGEANSPVTLVDDDSEETLVIQLDDSGATSSGGGSNNVPFPTGTGGGAVTVERSLFLVLAAALLAGVWFLSQEFGNGGISTTMLFVGEAALVGLLAVETLSPASLVGGVAEGISSLLGSFGEGLATATPLIILAVAGLAFVWFRNRGKPEKVVNFRLGGGKEK